VLAEFDSLDAVDAWKAHPEHALAQQRGQEFFADYRIQICNLVRTNESAKTLYWQTKSLEFRVGLDERVALVPSTKE